MKAFNNPRLGREREPCYMIEYALLIMLGFCASGLIALLLAPTLWHRAVRLTTVLSSQRPA